MSKLTRLERCGEALTQRALADPFLGTADQRPEVNRLLAEMAKSLAQEEDSIRSRLRQIVDEMRGGVGDLSEVLRSARGALEAGFKPLQDKWPPAPPALQQISHLLENQEHHLALRLRPRLTRVLERAAPHHKHLQHILDELTTMHDQTIGQLAESVTLLALKQPDAVYEEGASVFQLAMEPRLAQLCRTRFLAGLRYRRLRRRLKRQYRLLSVPLQDMAREGMALRTNMVPAKLTRRHENTHQELQTRLNDGWRSIRYSLETAAIEFDDLRELLAQDKTEEITDDVKDKPKELEAMVYAALDKLSATLSEVAEVYATVLNGFLEEIGQEHVNAIATIHKGVDEAGSLRGRLRWAARSLYQNLQRRRHALKDALAKRAQVLTVHRRRVTALVDRWMQMLKNLLGIRMSVKETMLQLTDLPLRSEVKQQAKSLPAIYRRMFSSDPLINREFMVSFNSELKSLHASLARWQSGRAASVMIAGPDGSGKTSLLNSFENELESQVKIVRLGLDKRLRKADELILLLEGALDIQQHSATLDQLVDQLIASPRRIVIMEQAHQLMLRTIGGREAVEALFYVIMATRKHLMWILSGRYHAWKRLEYLLNAQQYFTHIIITAFLGKEELREALMLRQRATGLDMLFSDKGVDVPRLRSLRLTHALDSAPVQQLLADRYFSTLYAMSGGSMTAALFYWLQTQQVGTAGKIMVIPCVRFDDRFIKNLGRPYLLTLAEILCHGTLTPEEHGVIFRMDGLHSRLLLDYLCEISLVEMHEEVSNGHLLHYGMNPVFYYPVSVNLESLNILY